MKTVTLIATEYGVDNHGLNNHTVALDIAIENDTWSDDDVLDAIKDAAKDYCLTDDGKRTFEIHGRPYHPNMDVFRWRNV